MPQPMDHDQHLLHLAEANRHFADQIKTADQKAAYVFTFLVAVLIWSTEVRQAFRWRLAQWSDLPLALASLLTSLSIGAAILLAILAVLPVRGTGGTFLFWGAWPEAGEALAAAREAKDEDWLFRQYRENTAVLAGIAKRKFRLVTLSIACVLVGMLSYGLSAILRV